MPRKPARRSWGSVNTISRSKHVLRWVQNTPEGRRRMCETFHGTYREACARMSELQVMNGKSKPNMTVGQVAETWYVPWLDRRVKDGKTKDGTRHEYMRTLEDVVMPRWRDTPVDCTPPRAIQEWLLSLTSTQATRAVVVMRRLMDFAVDYELTDANRFRLSYEMPVTKKAEKRRDVYTLEQAETMLARLHGSMCEAPFILACFGSARLGESLAVLRSEVDEVERGGMTLAVVPIVRRIPRQGSDPAPDGDLKTRESARDIIIPEPYSLRLLEIARDGIVDGSRWLSPQHDGSTMSCGMLGWWWRREAGDDHIPFSNLRASWRTFAQYEWGIDYDTCEVLMGHRLQGVTGRHYLRPTREQLIDTFAEELGKVR